MIEQLIALTTLVASAAAMEPSAAEWRCGNDIEIRCESGECQVLDGQETTPMNLFLTADGEFSVCAYSGCWSGQGEVVNTDAFIIITKKDTEWSFEPHRQSSSTDVVIAFHRQDQLALVKASQFAIPFNCKPATK